MKKQTRTTLLLSGLLVGSACLAHGAITDITISDGLTGSNSFKTGSAGWEDPRGKGEAHEVEYGNVAHFSWDLRAFGYDYESKTLTYQGGYNPLMVNDPANSKFEIGSIFIETTKPLVLPPQGLTSGGDRQFLNLSNADFGYDYAITLIADPVGGVLKYDIYELTAQSVLLSAYFKENRDAGPYKLLPTEVDSLLKSGELLVAPALDAVTFDATYGVNGSNLQSFGLENYIAQFDLSFIADALSDGAIFRLTMACGNDSMMGQIGAYPDPNPGTSAIPEPGSMAGLMGLLLGGAFLRSRRPSKA